MNYIITPNTTTKLNETSGTIQNISQSNKIEISNSADFTHNIILYPYETRAFNIQLYARLFDNNDLPVEIRVVPFTVGGGVTSGSSTETKVATDDEFNELLDEIFGTDTSVTSSDTISGDGGTVDINGTTYNVISDADFNSLLDDLGIQQMIQLQMMNFA